MKLLTENINVLWGSIIVEELVRSGVDYFCISPGSRSTPLTVAVAKNPSAKSLICYDERAAAYHALGYARATGKPAAVITTSGTAVANCLPAVVEADADRVPLLILSADRPPELQETAANQTIRQQNIFGNYLRWQFTLPCPDEKIAPQMLLTTVDQAVYRTQRPPAGAVHLNLMFREPLAPTPAAVPPPYLDQLERWQQSDAAYSTYFLSFPETAEPALQELAETLAGTRRGLLVAGKLDNRGEQDAVRQLAAKLRFPVFADIRSGLRLGFSDPIHITYFDQLLFSEKFRRRFQPELILHFGGQPLSKRFLQYLENYPPKKYLVVANHPFRQDPAHRVTHRIEADISSFSRDLPVSNSGKIDSAWLEEISAASQKIDRLLGEELNVTERLSEPAVARAISQIIPADQALFVASSMPIRDLDMFADPGGAPVPVAANRGASGIDGTIASAAGFAVGLGKPVTLLIGDLAFLHDLNSLSLLNRLQQPLTIVLLNNHGSGIFSFLPIAGFPDVFEKYFATPHTCRFEAAARMFDINYRKPQTLTEFKEVYQKALGSNHSTLIEVQTDREQNVLLHKKLQKKIIEMLKKQS